MNQQLADGKILVVELAESLSIAGSSGLKSKLYSESMARDPVHKRLARSLTGSSRPNMLQRAIKDVVGQKN